jgi:hemolysin III
MTDAAYSPREEFFNVLTHGLGTVLAAVGGFILVLWAAATSDLWLVGSVMVFAISLVLLYGASTLYHSVQDTRLKARLKVLDHASIYLLIAGTYTPFTLGPLRGPWGWSLFGVIWALAIAGVIFKLFYTGRFNRISTLLYIAMGWLVLVAVVPMKEQLAWTTLAWLIAGGISYTVGTVFYLSKQIPYSHAIWHLFVLGGSVSHAISIATL